MPSLALALFAAAASAASVGPCFGWSAASLQRYGLQWVETTLIPGQLPSNDAPSVQITAGGGLSGSANKGRLLAPSVLSGQWPKTKICPGKANATSWCAASLYVIPVPGDVAYGIGGTGGFDPKVTQRITMRLMHRVEKDGAYVNVALDGNWLGGINLNNLKGAIPLAEFATQVQVWDQNAGPVTIKPHVFYNTTLKFAQPVPPTWGRPDYLFKALGSKPQILDGGKTVVIQNIYHEESTYPQHFKQSIQDHSFTGQWPGPQTLGYIHGP